jgi:exopolysaccharide biosynthesis protein
MKMIKNIFSKLLIFLKKPYRWALVYGSFLFCAFVLVLLDIFVIPRALAAPPTAPLADFMPEPEALPSPLSITPAEPEEAIEKMAPRIGASSYIDEKIRIQIETIRKYDTTIHIADIQVSNAAYLKTAFAKNTYGRNINEITSLIAAEHTALFAINGDDYGFRDTGFVLRNGILYRDTGGGEAFVMDKNGNLSSVNERDISAGAVNNAWQIWSFGPALIRDSGIVVGPSTEIAGRAALSNPRTAIGQIAPLHYIMIVSNGRLREEKGLSLLELAEVFLERGCTTAYNLDGGGSSSMVFNGNIINTPTEGRRIGERKISDIIYIGYE